MESLSIRNFAEADLGFAYELNTIEQWNDRKEDLLRMYNYEPRGCFIAEVKKKPVGHVFSVCYGKLGWIGLLIVKVEYRRKGIATQLMKQAIGFLLRHGVQTIKLEAVPKMSELYRKFGFIHEYGSLRFSKAVKRPNWRMENSPASVKEKHIDKIAMFDKKYFGADRTKVLTSLFAENPQLCFESCNKAILDGYIMCRKTKNGHKVGPFVCNPENKQTAEDLLQACMNRLENTTLYIGVPETNKEAVGLLMRHGFTQYSKSVRMRFGQKLLNENVQGIFAIGGPEKG